MFVIFLLWFFSECIRRCCVRKCQIAWLCACKMFRNYNIISDRTHRMKFVSLTYKIVAYSINPFRNAFERKIAAFWIYSLIHCRRHSSKLKQIETSFTLLKDFLKRSSSCRYHQQSCKPIRCDICFGTLSTGLIITAIKKTWV